MPAVAMFAPTKLKLWSAARTHPGKRRSVNEDRILDRPQHGLWVVADGMGGHRGGDVAATRLVEALDDIQHDGSGYARLTDLTLKVERVNTALIAEGAGGGSTLVALLAHETYYACVWAGDSRGYVWRDAQLTAITHDHSLVQQLVDAGALLERDRKTHPSAHVITRAIGASPTLELEQRFAPIAEGDVFLLCSDGLTASITEDEIAIALGEPDLSTSADRLLEAALAGAASDNISFIIVVAGRSDAQP